MEEYEKQNNFKYDFVIRLRPDAKYITNLDLKRLNEVNNGELALKFFLIKVALQKILPYMAEEIQWKFTLKYGIMPFLTKILIFLNKFLKYYIIIMLQEIGFCLIILKLFRPI
ncbi:hypothetical protein WHP46_09270 [Campylobacter jejuni]